MASPLQRTAIATFGLFLMTTSLLAIELPRYDVVKADGALELRDYEASIVAETAVGGTFDRASNRAFRRLAGYIFGNNQSRIEGTEESEKIAMTAPVTSSRSTDLWTTRFTMPSQYSMATLPRPKDPRVEILEDPGGLFAVVRYSGRWTETRYRQQLAMLQQWITESALETVSEPVIARYDPPWTPWPQRRNEIMIAVRRTGGSAGPWLSPFGPMK